MSTERVSDDKDDWIDDFIYHHFDKVIIAVAVGIVVAVVAKLIYCIW